MGARTTGAFGSRRAGREYRGAKRRIRRIRMRGNWSTPLILFIIWMLFVLLVLVPWMTRHPHDHTHGAVASPHGDHAGPKPRTATMQG